MKSVTGGLIFRHSRFSELHRLGSPIALVMTLGISLPAKPASQLMQKRGTMVGPYRSVSSADFLETRFQAELHTTNVFVALSRLATPPSATPLYGS
jgi:hypothetical protein